MTADASQPGPMTGFRLRLDIGDSTAGWFTEVGGLSVERTVEEHPEGGVNDHVHWLPGRLTRSSLTLKNGIATAALWRWFQKGLTDAAVERRAVSIIVFDSQGNENRRWDLPEAFPVRWTGADLAAGTGEVAVEALELAQGSGGEGGEGSGDGGEENDEPPLDVIRLASKVYALLRHELRVERDRMGRRDFW